MDTVLATPTPNLHTLTQAGTAVITPNPDDQFLPGEATILATPNPYTLSQPVSLLRPGGHLFFWWITLAASAMHDTHLTEALSVASEAVWFPTISGDRPKS